MSITIYHNPDCGTSRNTLALIRNSGAEPTIIYYLETPPSGDELRQLLAAMRIPVRALLRKNVVYCMSITADGCAIVSGGSSPTIPHLPRR